MPPPGGPGPDPIDDAVRSGLTRAGKTLRNLDGIQVSEIRGQIDDGQVGHHQVTMKVGFRLEDGDAEG